MKIVIVGAGRMGRYLATKLNGLDKDVWVIDEDPLKAFELANECGCKSGTIEIVATADIVVLALPGEFVPGVAGNLKPYLQKGSLLVNIATRASTREIQNEYSGKGVMVAGVKMIGHARESLAGEVPILVADVREEEAFMLVMEHFSCLGPVIKGKEEMVETINSMATGEAVKAGLEIQKRLCELGVREELIKAAIINAAAGSLKAFARGDLGGFANRLLEEETRPEGDISEEQEGLNGCKE